MMRSAAGQGCLSTLRSFAWGTPTHVKEFRLGQTVDLIRHQGNFVQTEIPSRQAQYAANKDWLEAQFDKDWLRRDKAALILRASL